MVKSGPLSSVCLRKPSKERCFEVRMTRPGEQWLEKATKSTVHKRTTPSLSQEPRARPIRSVLAHRQMPDAPRPSLQGREGGAGFRANQSPARGRDNGASASPESSRGGGHPFATCRASRPRHAAPSWRRLGGRCHVGRYRPSPAQLIVPAVAVAGEGEGAPSFQ